MTDSLTRHSVIETPADWRALLQPIEYAILRESATERPETGRYNEDPGAGAFHCAGCGQRLYGAEHKFHSGCGWPSFVQEVEPGALEIHRDTSHGMVRTEVRCKRCGGHLGHVFPDGPGPRGERYCMNSASLRLEPRDA